VCVQHFVVFAISCVFNHKLAFSLGVYVSMAFSREGFLLGRMEDGCAELEHAVSLLRMSCHLNFRGSFQSRHL
jgi:hypothetical protein